MRTDVEGERSAGFRLEGGEPPSCDANSVNTVLNKQLVFLQKPTSDTLRSLARSFVSSYPCRSSFKSR
jgi:hypothetical protein